MAYLLEEATSHLETASTLPVGDVVEPVLQYPPAAVAMAQGISLDVRLQTLDGKPCGGG